MSTNETYDGEDFLRWFRFTGEQILHYTRPWWRREWRKAPLHRAVELAILQARPADWHQLLLEYPHTAETDATRLAYTRDERAGEADRQTITTVGKYLTRHFPTLPDHAIRDLVHRTTTQSHMFIVETMPLMLHHLMDGPGSCMNNGWRGQDMASHPYNVYQPDLGWSMAVRMFEGQTDGRALVYREADGTRYFVRTYKRTEGYSETDDELVAWLKAQGINRRSSWEGAYLAKLPPVSNNYEFLAPYLDGDCKNVDIYDAKRLVVNYTGDYECDNTDGTHSGCDRYECEDCGSTHRDEDDGQWVGYHADRWVCQDCVDHNYSPAIGRRGSEYWTHTSNIITSINGEAYDCDYLADNDIVELENGDYASIEESWCCAESGYWYLHDRVSPVEINGDTYHPDSAAARARAEEKNEEEQA